MSKPSLWPQSLRPMQYFQNLQNTTGRRSSWPRKKLLDLHYHSIRLLSQNLEHCRFVSRWKEMRLKLLAPPKRMRILNVIPLRSQSSRTSARVRLQAKFVDVETTLKDESTPAEISERIRQIVTDAMAKSAVYEDVDPPLGGFKRNNASSAFDSFLSDTVSLMSRLICSNIDPCQPRTHLSGMCIRVLIDTNVTATLCCLSRPSRTRSKSPLPVSTMPPVTS
jgi:hypothetical protein